ncbi:MAG TPA: hypothetical protein VKR56_03135 [Candidatus Cybelea sp.]|nr:hypothetical protein [Candidatus Cybelea sp.]
MSPNRLWLCIAAIPLLAGASVAIQTTIPDSVAPITIDQCAVTQQKVAAGSTFSDYLDFTNVSQRTATEVRFAFRIVDAIGRTEGSVTDDRVGRFAPGIAISHSTAAPAAPRAVGALPASSKIVCSVQMVRFDDGSIWNDGDGPVGSGTLVTPPPQPAATPPWQWPFDRPTPPAGPKSP